MISNKMFNLAVISCLLNISALLCIVKCNDSLLLKGAFWLTCAMMVVLGLLAIVFKIREYINRDKKSCMVLVASAIGRLGVTVLHIGVAVNLYGLLCRGELLVPPIVAIIGAVLIAASAALWPISFIVKKESRESKTSFMTYSKCLMLGAGLFIACVECFAVCLFIPTNNLLMEFVKLGLSGALLLLAMFFTIAAAVIVFKIKCVGFKADALSKVLTAAAVFSVEFNLLLFAAGLLSFGFSILMAVIGVISLLLFIVAAELKLIHLTKSNNSIK